MDVEQANKLPADELEPNLPASTSSSVPPDAPDENSPAIVPEPEQASLLVKPDVNKDVPPTPPSEPEEETEEVLEIVLPEIVASSMFLPIPNTDPLTTLLTKYIFPPERRPVRDLTGDWQRSDFHTLVMTNSWRALAKMARDRIVATKPQDLPLILSLWYLRLSSLARLRLFNQAAAECTNLFAVLKTIEPPAARQQLWDRIMPFELEVLYTRLKYWSGDHMSYLDSLNLLLRKCKSKSRISRKAGDTTSVAMWKERGSRISLIIGSQLVEMKDFVAAAKHLEPLCEQNATSSPALRSAVARIYLQGGCLSEASLHFSIVASDPNVDASVKATNRALFSVASGDLALASESLRFLLEEDSENYVAVNNFAVVLLSQGRLKEAISLLEGAIKSSPSSVVVAEPFLFNLSTLYELRSAAGVEKKRDLLVEVAKWSGDGLKTTCLKMPSN